MADAQVLEFDEETLGKVVSFENLLEVLQEHFSEEQVKDIYNDLKFKLEASEGIVNAYMEDKLAMLRHDLRPMMEEMFRRLMQDGLLVPRVKSITDISSSEMAAFEQSARLYLKEEDPEGR